MRAADPFGPANLTETGAAPSNEHATSAIPSAVNLSEVSMLTLRNDANPSVKGH
ncbi:hypothetical protein D3C76_1830330 [compost metagenome]